MEASETNQAGGIKVPENLLNNFRQRAEQSEGQPGAEYEAPLSFNGETDQKEYSGEILDSLNETLSWICKTADGQAKQRGYPGLGDVPPDQLGELLTIVAKRNLPPSIIEKSPETACVAVLGGIAVQNWLAHREKMKTGNIKNNENGNNEG